MDVTRLVVWSLLAAGGMATVVYLRHVGRARPEEVPDMFRTRPDPVAAGTAREPSRLPLIDRELPARLEVATFAFG